MKNIFKRLLSFSLAAAVSIGAAAGITSVTAYAADMAERVIYTPNLSGAPAESGYVESVAKQKWFDDGDVEWIAGRTEWEWGALVLNAEGNNLETIKMRRWGNRFGTTLSMRPNTGGRSFAGSFTASVDFSGEIFTNENTSMEARFLEGEYNKSYIGFGMDLTAGTMYYTIDGEKTPLGEMPKNESGALKPSAKLSVTAENGKVSYTFGSFSGEIEIEDLSLRTDCTVNPLTLYVNIPDDKQVFFSNITVGYGLGEKQETVSYSESFTSDMGDHANETKQGIIDNDNASWDFVGAGWYSAVSFKYGFRMLAAGDCSAKMLCSLKTGDKEFSGIKSSSVEFTIPSGLASGNAEVRYFLTDKDTAYIALGVDGTNGFAPYYRVGNEKVYAPSDKNVTVGSTVGVSMTVADSRVYYTIGSWKGNFDAPNIKGYTENIQYPISLYVGPTSSEWVYFGSFNLTYSTQPGADFVENFDEYTEDNAQVGAENSVSATDRFSDKTTVVASNERVIWEPSFVSRGRGWNPSTNSADIYSNTYIDKESGRLALMGSYEPSAVNMFLKDKVYDVSKLSADITKQSQRRTALRFLISDDEQSYYEIGLSGWKDNDRFKQVDGKNYENRFYIFEVRNVQGDRQSNYSGKLTWSSDETGYAGTFNITVIPTDSGFKYSVIDKANGSVVFEGVYTDSTGKRLRPDSDMPTLALSIAQAETDRRAYLDNVKLWYTPVCDISARAENGKAVVTLAPNQLKADSASIIAASFDANGGLLDISETAIEDMTEGARDITVEKAEGAASMRIYIWKGDTSNPKPLTDAPLTVSFN